MGVLRLLGGGTILENNIVQTGASAGSSIAAGVIFTIPALIILGYWRDFQYSWVLAIAGLGGLLGVLFSVPLRRSMIVEEPLPFPEGKAAAEVLKAGENPGPGLKILAFLRRHRCGAQGRRAQRHAPDPGYGRGRRLFRQVPGLYGDQPVAGAAGRGLYRGPEHRHRGAVRQHPVLAHRHPAVPHVLHGHRPGAGAEHRRCGAGRRGWRDLVGQDPLPGRGRDADWRGLDAVLAAQVAAVGREERHRRRTCRFRRRRSGRDRARPADEVDAGGAGGVRAASAAAVPGHCRLVARQYPRWRSS
jgi:hypothetical protein